MTSLDSLRALDLRVHALVEKLERAEGEKTHLAETVADREKQVRELEAQLSQLKNSRETAKKRVEELITKLEAVELGAS